MASVPVVAECRRTKKFSSGAGCKDFKPRKAVMPAPSAATAGSAAVPLATALRSDQPHTGSGRVLEVAEAAGAGQLHRIARAPAAAGLDLGELRPDVGGVDVRQGGHGRRVRLED